MNRAERRRQEQLGVNKAHIMEQYRKEAYDAGWHDGLCHEIEITFNMLAYTLTYKTGYSTARIKQLLHDLYFNLDSYRTEHLDANDYQVICKELESKGLTFHEIMKDID